MVVPVAASDLTFYMAASGVIAAASLLGGLLSAAVAKLVWPKHAWVLGVTGLLLGPVATALLLILVNASPLFAVILVGLLICAWIGAALGRVRGRPGLGFLLGLFGGPTGWIVIVLVGQTPQAWAEEQAARRDMAEFEEFKRKRIGP